MSEFDSKRKIVEKAEQRNNVRKEKLAGYLYDISKLIFGGIVLAGLSPIFTDATISMNYPVIISGLFASVILAVISNQILKV